MMTPEQIAIRILEDTAMHDELRARLVRSITATIAASIATAITAERERYARLCDAISDDKHDQYKGRGAHAPKNDHRADTYTEGESSGAALCADAIRAAFKDKP